MEVRFSFRVSSGKLPTVMAFNPLLTLYSFHICSLVSLLPVNLLEQELPVFSGAQGGTWQCTGGRLQIFAESAIKKQPLFKSPVS